MSKTIVISGHPNLEASFTNTVILDGLQTQLDDVSVRRLDRLYPDYQIDVEAEQAALLEADVIVLQFPFYWYSVPALLKKWVDDVMSFNFAYGPEGNKLKGKDFFLSFTIGGPEESYDPQGYNHFTIEQFIYPLQQTAYLAGMNYHKPVYTHRMVYIPGVYNELDEVQARARAHTDRLVSEIRRVTESDERLLRNFVHQWFAKFDVLSDDEKYFTQFLASDAVLSTPEGNFKGHEGFSEWYSNLKATFKSGCEHLVEQFTMKPSEQGYQLELRVRLKAETFMESVFKGETIDLNVNETWLVSTSDGEIKIQDYQVVPMS
ncbi:FMN reductase [Photobacterium jeanii]|uniref:FMN reductase n=1 Tax=Photobacterium jeanii TaxID=858640 RepID=A0A178KMG7_9GAMM|nr:NAD(P)H-dependent oxidoreductase [Photobacterium jeanii]OAN17873.1 FMN reductase [Photobacterium jeanii]PST92459.1 flavodoxin family protein [Photobacterium jeanii]